MKEKKKRIMRIKQSKQNIKYKIKKIFKTRTMRIKTIKNKIPNIQLKMFKKDTNDGQ